MLPKVKRLRTERDYKRVYTRGSFFSVKLFNVNYSQNQLGTTRLAFVINKKTAKSAVVRNAVKRKYREAFSSLYDTLPAGYDVIVNIKRESLVAKYEDILADAKKVADSLRPKQPGSRYPSKKDAGDSKPQEQK
jgi:ribonuclease P protein component